MVQLARWVLAQPNFDWMPQVSNLERIGSAHNSGASRPEDLPAVREMFCFLGCVNKLHTAFLLLAIFRLSPYPWRDVVRFLILFVFAVAIFHDLTPIFFSPVFLDFRHFFQDS